MDSRQWGRAVPDVPSVRDPSRNTRKVAKAISSLAPTGLSRGARAGEALVTVGCGLAAPDGAT